MNSFELEKRIKEENWNNNLVTSFEISDFENYKNLLKELDTNEDKAEFHEFCENILNSNSSSVIARFLFSLSGHHPSNDRQILEVLEDLVDSKKLDVVEYMAKLILTFNESDYVLRVLADLYDKSDREEEKISIWERIVRIDYDEIEILMKLSEYFEAKNDKQTAMNYYQRSAQRLLKIRDFSNLKYLWIKIVDIKKNSPEYLINTAERFAQNLKNEQGAYFFNYLLDSDICDLEQSIDILKRVIKTSDNNVKQNVNKLISKYKEKYKNNIRLDYCLKETGLQTNFQDINVAIEKFETQIQFVESAFVFHKTWGIGRIMKINSDTMIIQFATKGKHTMTSEMAYTSLRVLKKSHIWVLKSVIKKERLKEKIQGQIAWALICLIKSNGGSSSLKEMKKELVPSILTQNEWATWYTQAKKELMSNPNFGFSENNIESYVYKKSPSTFEEKKLNLFRSEKDFFSKLRCIRDYIQAKGDLEDENFSKMLNFFEIRAKVVCLNIENISSWLFLNDLKTRKNLKFVQLANSFDEFYNLVENQRRFFEQIDDSDIKRLYLEQVKEYDLKNWPFIFKDLFPYYLNTFILDTLIENKQKKVYLSILYKSVESFKEEPEVLIYLRKNLTLKDWLKANVYEGKLILAELQLLNYTSKCIENKNDVSKNRRLSTTLIGLLFDGNSIENYLSQCDDNNAKIIYSLIKSNPKISSVNRNRIKTYITEKFVDADQILGTNTVVVALDENVIPTGLLCTQQSLDGKLAELKNLIEVEIPENAKEIGIARELGDLRENAEYQYGKDKQKNLTFLRDKLSQEINNSTVIKSNTVDESKISFGTVVNLKDNVKNSKISYTVMGQWESDPKKGILNFKAPLCRNLYNHQVGDVIKFSLNEVDYDFTVLEITKADF
ncbi:MAG: GreA/GreB family elongation factor [Sphaerochaetaceae bacterium]